MVESFLAVPLHFTVEFLGFLVPSGAAVLVLSRPSLIPGNQGNRIVAALGFGILAAAQVAHGGSFTHVETDGADVLVIARTVGLLLILAALIGGLRLSPSAAIAVTWSLEKPALLAPAAVAFLI